MKEKQRRQQRKSLLVKLPQETPEQISNNIFSKLVKEQYEELRDDLDLDIEGRAKNLLIPQTVLGRAQSGHGSFKGAARPNTTLAEIYDILGMNSEKMRHRRQALQDDFKHCIDDIFDGKTDRLVGRNGRPIFGVNFLSDIKISPDRETFQGGALVARMDMEYWRERTVIQYQNNLLGNKLTIGRGKEMPVSINRLATMPGRLSIPKLANDVHTKEDIAKYREFGLIVDKERLGRPGVENLFIRMGAGLGVCDDASMISIGLLYGKDAMTLGFGIDATDTYTKFGANTVVGGFDEHLGKYICARWQEKWGEELLTPEQTTQIIYLGAKNTLYVSPFSTSHRRFVERESKDVKNESGEDELIKQKNSTFINHLNYVLTGKEEDFNLGFNRFPSHEFYQNMRDRFNLSGLSKYLPTQQQI